MISLKMNAENSFSQDFLVRGKNMFSFFKSKKAGENTPVSKKISSMKCRKISYVYTDFNSLCNGMQADCSYILKLEPVNYYAEKNKYIVANIYTSNGFDENYVQFFKYTSERECGKSDIFPLDRYTLSKTLAKVGIIINA